MDEGVDAVENTSTKPALNIAPAPFPAAAPSPAAAPTPAAALTPTPTAAAPTPAPAPAAAPGPLAIYTYEELCVPATELPADVDKMQREVTLFVWVLNLWLIHTFHFCFTKVHLSDEEFSRVFGVKKEEFDKMPVINVVNVSKT